MQTRQGETELDHKNRELTTSAIHLLNKNKILSEIQKSLENITNNSIPEFQKNTVKLIREINNSINLDSDREQFKLHFEKVNPGFFTGFQQKYPQITNNDMKLCAYMKINLSSKEIAQMLNITLAGVNKRLYRLRKKIDISKSVSLTEFLSNL